tara:strand:- start:134 stop:1051 length:918 start_codon:yes stop_codon:yes gene_type:complete
MASNITRSSASNLLVEGIKLNFGVGYEQSEKVSRRIFDVVSSDRETEKYQEFSSLGNHSVKSEGASAVADTMSQSFKTYIENLAYAKKMNITHEMLMDNKYNDILQQALDLGVSAANTMEVVAIDRLNTAFSTASADVLADGSALCATDHPLAGGGTQSNAEGTPSALSESSLISATTAIGKFKDPRGNKIHAKGQLLIVPVDLDVTAQKLLFSTLTVGSNNNDLNPFGRVNGRLPGGYVSTNEISDSNAFFVKTNLRGLVIQEREKPRIMEDFKNSEMVKEVVSYFRMGCNAYDHRAIFGNAGA